MRPALLWLRTLIVLATVMLTMGEAAWAMTTAERETTIEACTCVEAEVTPSDKVAPEQDRYALPCGDEDRSELLILPEPWLPTPMIGTHPAMPADLSPVQPWLSLPLRPPRH